MFLSWSLIFFSISASVSVSRNGHHWSASPWFLTAISTWAKGDSLQQIIVIKMQVLLLSWHFHLYSRQKFVSRTEQDKDLGSAIGSYACWFFLAINQSCDNPSPTSYTQITDCYIGETSKPLRKRLQQHTLGSSVSAVFDHLKASGYKLTWKKSK